MNSLPYKLVGLSFKSILVGSVGSAIISASSVYVALRLSSLPWTILFAVIISYSLIVKIGRGSLHEVNIAHTAMTAGSMSAAATAFIIPAWWRLYPDSNLNPFLLMAAMLVAIIIALSYTYMLRNFILNQLHLPYPIGRSAYETIMACHDGGAKSHLLFASTAAASLFTILRDWVNFIPQVIISNSYGRIAASPMTVAMGYLLGPKFSLAWAISSVITLFAMLPMLMHYNIAENWQAAKELQKEIGIGLLIGAGLGTLLRLIIANIGVIVVARKADETTTEKTKKHIIVSLSSALFIMLTIVKLPWQSSLLLFPVTLFAAILVALLVGQGGLNPLEVIGAMAFLLITLVHLLTPLQALLIILISTMICALTGDMMNDFKAGQLLNSSPFAMLIGDAIGAIVGMVVSITTLFVIKSSFDLFSADSPFTAAQSNAIAIILSTQVISQPMIIAIIVAIIMALTPVPAIAVALGFYLAGYGIGSLVAVGGILALIAKHYSKEQEGKMISSGILAGEGLVGALLAFLMMLKL